VRLAGADDAAVRPHWNSLHRVRRLSPFHLFDYVGVGLLDEISDPSERLGPPIVQRLDSRIDLLGGRANSSSYLRASLCLLHDCGRFLQVFSLAGRLSSHVST